MGLGDCSAVSPFPKKQNGTRFLDLTHCITPRIAAAAFEGANRWAAPAIAENVGDVRAERRQWVRLTKKEKIQIRVQESLTEAIGEVGVTANRPGRGF
jgi:hypothetical protein